MHKVFLLQANGIVNLNRQAIIGTVMITVYIGKTLHRSENKTMSVLLQLGTVSCVKSQVHLKQNEQHR